MKNVTNHKGITVSMPHIKIVAIGVGSFVFGPSILSQIILEQQLNGVELALVDVDAEIVELMAGVGRQMARQSEVEITISAHTERMTALDGADFVICSVARQGFKRFMMDVETIQRYSPGHQITEFGGIAGISNSLRQIAMILELTDDMRRLCPQAWLLNVANPLPRVCQAAQTQDIRTLGFCSVSLQAYEMAWQILYGQQLEYPFTQACEQWQITTAGLNHFVWLVDFQHRQDGTDMLPQLRQALAESHTSGNPVSETLARETNFLLVPHDDHTRDFLHPDRANQPVHTPFHGTEDERQQRIALLKRIAQGEEGYDTLLQNPSWERPIDVVAALAFGKPTTLHSLNMMNEGQIPNLPRYVFVETPCTITANGPKPHTITLPESVLPLCQRTAQVTDTIVQAALQHKRVLVHQATELDPTVLDKAAGIRAIDACLDVHADILPHYT